MDSYLKNEVKARENEVTEKIHVNLKFLMNYYGWNKKKCFIEDLSRMVGVRTRTLNSWYNRERLPSLGSENITLVTSFLKVQFVDLISREVCVPHILTNRTEIFIPSDIAKENVLTMFIEYDIHNGQKFESFFEGKFSSNYFDVLHRKNRHQRNISWKFIFTASVYFNTPLREFFKNNKE